VKYLAAGFLVVLMAAGTWSATSADRVSWDVTASGGVVGSSSSSYRVSASVGQTGVGLLGGATYQIYSGFWNPWLISVVEAEDEGGWHVPVMYSLSQNSPNPFSSETTIQYAVPKQSHVMLEVFNLRGERVRLLANGVQEPGHHAVRWDGTDAAGQDVGSGVYLCRIIARCAGGRAFMQSREMLLAR
jgi:hypothetical protein